MNWIATPESSAIIGFGYKKAAQVLTIKFKNGRYYNYYDVPEAVFKKMQAAPSKGQFFAGYVRDIYRYARI